MPQIDYNFNFTLDTEIDIDIIQFLDQYPEGEKRDTVLKAIIRFYITKMNEFSQFEQRLDGIDDALHFLKELIENLKLFTIAPKDDIINSDIPNQELSEAKNNIYNIFKE